MQNLRNAAFILIACAVVFCCIGSKVADRVLNVIEAPEISLLEGRKYQAFPVISKDSMTDGSFQKQAEQYVADLVPLRDSVLLANAQAQRSMIIFANAIPRYKVYPTFFGSKYCCTSDGKRVIEAPSKRKNYNDKRLSAAANEYNQLFGNNADVNWFVFMSDRGASSMGSPLHGLFSDAIDYDMLEAGFLDRLQGASVLNACLDTNEEFSESRYLTDHHWNAYGAVAGYETIMDALGREPIAFEGYRTVFDDKFYGSAARNGLCITESGDKIEDAVYQHSDLEISFNGKAVKLEDVNEAWSEDCGASFVKSGEYANVYADFFHSDVAEITFHNDNGTGNLLILGDSFTDCMDRFFAESYENVYVLDLRRYKGSAQEYIDKHDIDDAVVLMCCTNLLGDKVCSRLNEADAR